MKNRKRNLKIPRTLLALLFTFIFFPSAIAGPTAGNIVEEARSLLGQLRGGKLSLDAVLEIAVKNSDSYRSIRSSLIREDISILQAKAPLDIFISSEITTRLDKSQQSAGFAPEETKITSFAARASKYFTTGTSLTAELTNNRNQFAYNAALASNALLANAFQTDPQYDTRLNLILSQKLWQDSFGSTTRTNLEAAGFRKKIVTLQTDETTEDWALRLIEIFYGAWLAQARVETDKANVSRQLKLLEITRIKYKRGTSEKPDLLETKAAWLQAVQQLKSSRQSLDNIWRNLVVLLNLPDAFLSLDPTIIPLIIDNPLEEALAECGSSSKLSPAPESNIKITRLERELEASGQELKAAKDRLDPDLSLNLIAGMNGLDSSIGGSFKEFGGLSHHNITLGLSFSMPLSRSGEKAAVKGASLGKTLGGYALSQEKDSLKTAWINSCSALHTLNGRIAEYKKIEAMQKERSGLEKNRFKIGRVPSFNVIQAGHAVSMAEMTLKSAEAEIRLEAWKLRKLRGSLLPYIEKLVTQ